MELVLLKVKKIKIAHAPRPAPRPKKEQQRKQRSQVGKVEREHASRVPNTGAVMARSGRTRPWPTRRMVRRVTTGGVGIRGGSRRKRRSIIPKGARVAGLPKGWRLSSTKVTETLGSWGYGQPGTGNVPKKAEVGDHGIEKNGKGEPKWRWNSPGEAKYSDGETNHWVADEPEGLGLPW